MSGREARRAREHARAEAMPVRLLASAMRWEGPPPEESLIARELFAREVGAVRDVPGDTPSS